VVDKTAVRLLIEIQSDDKRLQKWSDVIRDYEIDAKVANFLGRSLSQPDKWYIYNGTITKDKIKAIDYNPYLPDEPPKKHMKKC
jgi:hypothetical protein